MSDELFGTGIHQEVKGKYGADIPEQRDGEHLWTWAAAWRCVDPESDTVNLDSENLLTISGPGCFYCEEPYSPRVAHRRCRPVPAV